MAVQASLTVDTTGELIRGDKVHRSGQTLLQDAGRSAALVNLTVMSQIASSLKWVPLTDVTPTLTSASLACGVNGGLIAAYQNADNEFAITIDGTLTNIQWDGTAIVALTDIAPAINTISIPLGVICSYNEETNTFYFSSLKQGLPASSITVLTAVAGGAGTDISGATHLNGLTAVGTVTAATGGDGENIPGGLLWGNDVTAAALVAGDVTDKNILVGKTVEIDETKIILENSLTLDTIIAATGKTIRTTLFDQGIYARPTEYFQNIQPIA